MGPVVPRPEDIRQGSMMVDAKTLRTLVAPLSQLARKLAPAARDQRMGPTVPRPKTSRISNYAPCRFSKSAPFCTAEKNVMPRRPIYQRTLSRDASSCEKQLVATLPSSWQLRTNPSAAYHNHLPSHIHDDCNTDITHQLCRTCRTWARSLIPTVKTYIIALDDIMHETRARRIKQNPVLQHRSRHSTTTNMPAITDSPTPDFAHHRFHPPRNPPRPLK
jgi:hypothetical protein